MSKIQYYWFSQKHKTHLEHHFFNKVFVRLTDGRIEEYTAASYNQDYDPKKDMPWFDDYTFLGMGEFHLIKRGERRWRRA